ncbi:MAG TPA: hypothetical protein VFG33_36220 [Kribbella sp.]|uniref:hypothetical protein n=1 Tax=Kribbella sp. TaxID=1871183 RepID=UPI002D782C32|nr:hypothetical protein [Kribbella sp.]HET6298872.1 hypothetical protein [Kribbella sp.]
MKVRAPNGQTLSVEGNPLPFNGRWAYIAWLFGQGGAQRFNITPAGSAELISKELGDWQRLKIREASWNGGRIVSMEDPEHAGTTMVWVGPHNEISSYVGGVGVPLEVFMDMLSKFAIDDAVEGLTLLPLAGSGLEHGRLLATNVIDQLCSVQIRPIAEAAETLPRSQGKQVRGGSMWRLDDRDDQGTLLTRTAYVVNDTTATSVITYQPDDPKFISVAGSLTCSLSN